MVYRFLLVGRFPTNNDNFNRRKSYTGPPGVRNPGSVNVHQSRSRFVLISLCGYKKILNDVSIYNWYPFAINNVLHHNCTLYNVIYTRRSHRGGGVYILGKHGLIAERKIKMFSSKL